MFFSDSQSVRHFLEIPSDHWSIEYSQELCPLKQQASPLSGPLVAAPQVAPALTPAFALHRTSFAAVVDFAFALSLQHLSFAPAFWWQRIELSLALSRWRLNVTPSLALSWRYAPAHCLTIRAEIQLLVCCSSGFLTLPASSTPAVPMAFRVCTPLPSSTRIYIRAFGFYHLALSHHHAPSSPVLSPRPFWPCPITTLHIAVHALHRLPSPTHPCLTLLLSYAFSFVRDGSLLTSRTTSNLQAWTPTPQYEHSTCHLYPLEFFDLSDLKNPDPNLDNSPVPISRNGSECVPIGFTICRVDPFHNVLGIGC